MLQRAFRKDQLAHRAGRRSRESTVALAQANEQELRWKDGLAAKGQECKAGSTPPLEGPKAGR